MDGRTDPLNDAALEQEVEALVSVQPSPEFVARVRSRVAEESMSVGWGWRWPIAAVATTVAVAVVGIVLWQPAQQPAVPAPRLAAAILERPVPVPPGPGLVPHIVPPQPVRVLAPRRSIDIAMPPVIIAENETRAFAMLVKAAPTTQFDFTPPASPSPGPLAVDKMPKMDVVTIEPIVIKPLAGETAE
jgi:hypothetical protein